ncbi:hypothetical protein ABG768_021310 [Culter alburnus]|uniref:Sushi domain-containing protein n=1 Tax=Culter alburnus TaxID=194366 RepID=A0AAW2AQV3_CULAL
MLEAESDVSTQHKCRTSLRGGVISYTFVWIYPSAFHLNSPGQADMHVLLILIFMTAANQHNFARASGFCGPPQINYTVPVHETYPINKTIRLQCVEGYVRKAGTSNLIRCTEKHGKLLWDYILNFECIPDPRKPNVPKTDTTTPHVTKTETQMPHFTSSTTESTEIKISTVLGTSMPTTATGHITLTTTNEVVTTKTRRTTSQPTLKSTTKEAESITTTNEITSSTSSSFTSRDYMTATSSHSSSSSFTTITGVNVSVKTSTVSEETKMEATSSNYTSTVSGVTSIIIICLAAAVFLFCWRWRHRERSDRNGIQLYHNVCTSEHCSTDPNTAANKPSTVSVNDTNQPQTGFLNDVDTSDKLLPQTDSC